VMTCWTKKRYVGGYAIAPAVMARNRTNRRKPRRPRRRGCTAVGCCGSATVCKVLEEILYCIT
jgi:hypothetical protein